MEETECRPNAKVMHNWHKKVWTPNMSEDYLRHVKCSVCHETPRDVKIYTCGNGHVVCGKCFKEAQEKSINEKNEHLKKLQAINNPFQDAVPSLGVCQDGPPIEISSSPLSSEAALVPYSRGHGNLLNDRAMSIEYIDRGRSPPNAQVDIVPYNCKNQGTTEDRLMANGRLGPGRVPFVPGASSDSNNPIINRVMTTKRLGKVGTPPVAAAAIVPHGRSHSSSTENRFMITKHLNRVQSPSFGVSTPFGRSYSNPINNRLMPLPDHIDRVEAPPLPYGRNQCDSTENRFVTMKNMTPVRPPPVIGPAIPIGRRYAKPINNVMAAEHIGRFREPSEAEGAVVPFGRSYNSSIATRSMESDHMSRLVARGYSTNYKQKGWMARKMDQSRKHPYSISDRIGLHDGPLKCCVCDSARLEQNKFYERLLKKAWKVFKEAGLSLHTISKCQDSNSTNDLVADSTSTLAVNQTAVPNPNHQDSSLSNTGTVTETDPPFKEKTPSLRQEVLINLRESSTTPTIDKVEKPPPTLSETIISSANPQDTEIRKDIMREASPPLFTTIISDSESQDTYTHSDIMTETTRTLSETITSDSGLQDTETLDAITVARPPLIGTILSDPQVIDAQKDTMIETNVLMHNKVPNPDPPDSNTVTEITAPLSKEVSPFHGIIEDSDSQRNDIDTEIINNERKDTSKDLPTDTKHLPCPCNPDHGDQNVIKCDKKVDEKDQLLLNISLQPSLN